MNKNKKKIKVMIADSHEITRIGLQELLSNHKDIEITAIASKDEEVLVNIKLQKPDVIIMDNNFKKITSAEVARYTLKNYPSCKVIVHPSELNEEKIFKEVEAGVSGYVPKNIKPAILVEAVKTVYSGDKFMNEQITDIFINNFIKEKKEEEVLKKIKQILTKRELEVLKMITEGNSIKQIARKLFLSVRTAETYHINIKKKLRINHTAGLIKYALKNNIVEM